MLSQETWNWPIWQAADGCVANERPSLRTPLHWKVGLHVQSEDKHVFICAEPSLFSMHLFVVYLGSEIGEINAGSASRDPERSPAHVEQCAPRSKQQQATGTGTRTLKKDCVSVPNSLYLDALYRYVTYLFVGEGTWANALLSQDLHRGAITGREQQYGRISYVFFFFLVSGERVLPSCP